PHVGEAAAAGARQLLKVGPAQFWILGPEDELGARLAEAVAPTVGAVTPLSHSRSCIFVEGGTARDLLAKGIPIDLDPEEFPVGAFAQTRLHHTPVLLLRAAVDRYEIFALRSFALSIWEWLTTAALPLGYEVTV